MPLFKTVTGPRKRESGSTLSCVRFVDGRNREHYLFRAVDSIEGTHGVPLVDLKQVQSGHRLTAQGIIIRAALKNRSGKLS